MAEQNKGMAHLRLVAQCMGTFHGHMMHTRCMTLQAGTPGGKGRAIWCLPMVCTLKSHLLALLGSTKFEYGEDEFESSSNDGGDRPKQSAGMQQS